MMKSSKPDIIALLEEGFKGISAYHKLVESYGLINTFIVRIEDEERLKANWEKLRNRIAVYFQSNLESDFERWNLYLFFICPKPISKVLKYKIENDRISSRKIVIDSFDKKINDEVISVLINKYINFSFSLPNEKKELFDSYSSNSTIHKLLTNNKVAKSGINRKNGIERLYSKIKDDLS